MEINCENNPLKYVDPDGKNPVLIGAGLGGIFGGIAGGISAKIQGTSIVAGVVAGTVSGAVSGAAIGSGVGAVAIVGSFVGGVIGSVTETIIKNSGFNGLDPKDVMLDAAGDGVISVASAFAGVGLGKAAGALISNNAWGPAAKIISTMDASWGPAAMNAVLADRVASGSKPVVELVITILGDVLQDVVGPPVTSDDDVSPSYDGQGNVCGL